MQHVFDQWLSLPLFSESNERCTPFSSLFPRTLVSHNRPRAFRPQIVRQMHTVVIPSPRSPLLRHAGILNVGLGNVFHPHPSCPSIHTAAYRFILASCAGISTLNDLLQILTRAPGCTGHTASSYRTHMMPKEQSIVPRAPATVDTQAEAAIATTG
jgi:hypothetical protein